MPLATLLKKDSVLYLLSSDDFHTKNLKSNDHAYHWKTKNIVKVVAKKVETGDWLCADGITRDSYKLQKIIAQDWEIILSDADATKIGYLNITKLAEDFILEGFSKYESDYQRGMIDGIVLFYPEIVKRLNLGTPEVYQVNYEQENNYFRVELIN